MCGLTCPLVLLPATGMQLQQGKPLTPAHLQMLRQQQLQQQQQQQQQAASSQIKAVPKSQVHWQRLYTIEAQNIRYI